MGPRLNSRGDSRGGPSLRGNRMLQWGRDLIVAETRPYREPSRLFTELQWGRDLIVAETPARGSTEAARAAASMGPRLNSRGNPEHPAADSRHPRLQWGRDLIVAETVILSAKYPSVIMSFNGAAT